MKELKGPPLRVAGPAKLTKTKQKLRKPRQRSEHHSVEASGGRSLVRPGRSDSPRRVVLGGPRVIFVSSDVRIPGSR